MKIFHWLLIALIFVCNHSEAQQKFAFKWFPNPSEFIKSNKETLFTYNEYCELIKIDEIDFDVLVSDKGVIQKIAYDSSSALQDSLAYGYKLSKGLAIKTSAILMQHIKLTNFDPNSQGAKDGKPIWIVMSLFFSPKDREHLQPWKSP
ncbi:MAG: hypothetical protein ABJH04_06265 [Cyclobacteriaceae bacterium]